MARFDFIARWPRWAVVSAAVLLVGVVAIPAYLLESRPRGSVSTQAKPCLNQSAKLVNLLSDNKTTAIRISNPDLSDMRMLRTEPADILPGLFDSLLSLSGDDSQLAYVTAINETMDEAHIWYIDVANPADRRELAYIPKGFWVVKPVWSPDNRRLAFVTVKENANGAQAQFELQVARVGGGPGGVSKVADLRPESFRGGNTASICWANGNPSISEVLAESVAASPGEPGPTASPKAGGTGCGVPVLSQNDPAWRRAVMQAAGDEIGGYGCALTSTAMLLNYYGAPVLPPQLSACLGPGADPLYWGQAPRCTQGIVSGGNQFDFTWQKLDSELQEGRPAIVGMLRGQTGMHFVVVTSGGGGNSADYAVTDPWDATTTKTLQSFISTGYNLRWVVTYDGPGRNCTRLKQGGLDPTGRTRGPTLAGVIDGGVYRDEVRPQVVGDTTDLVGASIANVTPAHSPDAINKPVPQQKLTPGLLLRDEGVYEANLATKSNQGSLRITRVKFTIDRTPPELELVVVGGPDAKPGVTPPQRTPTTGPTAAPTATATPSTSPRSTASATATPTAMPTTSPRAPLIATAAPTGAATPLPTQTAGPRATPAVTASPTPGPQTSSGVPSPAAPSGTLQLRKPVKIVLRAHDTLSGVARVEYRLDGGDWRQYSDDTNFARPIPIEAVGNHTISARATDLAGNVAVKTFSFAVLPEDKTTPVPTPTATSTPHSTPTTTPTPTPTASPTPTPTATAPPKPGSPR